MSDNPTSNYKLSETEYFDRKNNGADLVEQIKATITIPELQFHHIGIFYTMIIQYWYETNNKQPKEITEALSEIQEQDPKFYQALQIIAGPHMANDKATACEIAYARLFK